MIAGRAGGVLQAVVHESPAGVADLLGGHRRGLVIPVEAVGQGRVVAVPGGFEPHLHRARGRHLRLGGQGLGLALGGQRGLARTFGVAHDPLLGRAVGLDELTHHEDVGVGDVHLIGGLGHTRVLARLQVRVPADDRGALVARRRPVLVPVDHPLVADGDVGAVSEGHGPHIQGVRTVLANLGHIGEPVDGLAGVGVPHRVDGVLGRGDPVSVTVAGLEPDEVAVPVRPEAPLKVGLVKASDGGVGGAVETVVVDGDVEDGGLLSGCAHDVIDGHGQHLAGGGAQERHPVAGFARAVDRGEGAADDDLGVVRGDLDRVHLGIGPFRGGGPVQQLAGGGLEGGHPDARLTVHLGEVAPGVEGVTGDRDVLDSRVEHGLEGGDEGSVPLGEVEGRQAAVPLAVDLVELPGHVKGLAVLGEGQAASRPVEGGGEVLDEFPGVEVIGQDVGARDLLLLLGSAGRAGVVEAADDVDHVADDELPPGDAVDLHRGQGRGRVHGLTRGLAGGVGACSGGALVVTDVVRAVALVLPIGVGLLSHGHRRGGGQDDHRGEQQRQEGQDDGQTRDGGETTHGNLRYIWRATRRGITAHH